MRARFYKSPTKEDPGANGARVSRRMGEGLRARGHPTRRYPFNAQASRRFLSARLFSRLSPSVTCLTQLNLTLWRRACLHLCAKSLWKAARRNNMTPETGFGAYLVPRAGHPSETRAMATSEPAGKSDELAPFHLGAHSITSSAMLSSEGGTVGPCSGRVAPHPRSVRSVGA
jgi:hypothetical protein